MSYSPTPFGNFSTLEEVARFLRNELNLIALELAIMEKGQYEVLYVVPTRPRTGLVVYADGTSWNPGGGKGLYEYTGAGATGWRQLANGTQY